MDEKVKNHVTQYLSKEMDKVTDEDIINTLLEAEIIWRGDYDSHRWWDECLCVVDIDGMLIAFGDAITTGDDSAYDKGWEFDVNTICEVEEKTETVTVTTYKRKED